VARGLLPAPCTCSVALFHACAGYGGAVSVNVGLSAGLQLLEVSSFILALKNNVMTSCSVMASPMLGGNMYGGATSMYVGGYSSVLSSNVSASAAVGDTLVRNLSVIMDTTVFTSCTASTAPYGGSLYSNSFGASVWGGSFSVYIGAYAWSYSGTANSNSVSGATRAIGLTALISNSHSSNCSAVSMTSGIGGTSNGASVYGGSMNVFYIGSYSWSNSNAGGGSSSSTSGATGASDVTVLISNSLSSNCSALTTSSGVSGGLNGASAYGGSMSVLWAGSYSWSTMSNQSDRQFNIACEAEDSVLPTRTRVSMHTAASGLTSRSDVKLEEHLLVACKFKFLFWSRIVARVVSGAPDPAKAYSYLLWRFIPPL